MATPYFQLRLDSVASTQDVARESYEDLPVLVIAATQTRGRGRSGAAWHNADRAAAASLVFPQVPGDARPLSLMAGVAVVRATRETTLKWPNDVLISDLKVGGVLVERGDGLSVVGLGLNLWWAQAPSGMGALFDEDPGPDRHAEIAGLWGAELMDIVSSGDWPIDEYRESCLTLGRDISWRPSGAGKAIGVADDGALIVETETGREQIYSGEVHHVR